MWAERAAAARSGGAAAATDATKPSGSATAMDASPTKVEQPEPVIKDEPVPPQPSASSPPPAEAPKLEVKAEVKSEVKAEGANAAAGVPKLERMESSSYNVDWREPRMTHDPARDMVRKKLQEAFDKGKEANEVVLREQMTDTAAMAEQVETSMFELHGGTGNQYKVRAAVAAAASVTAVAARAVCVAVCMSSRSLARLTSLCHALLSPCLYDSAWRATARRACARLASAR